MLLLLLLLLRNNIYVPVGSSYHHELVSNPKAYFWERCFIFIKIWLTKYNTQVAFINI